MTSLILSNIISLCSTFMDTLYNVWRTHSNYILANCEVDKCSTNLRVARHNVSITIINAIKTGFIKIPSEINRKFCESMYSITASYNAFNAIPINERNSCLGNILITEINDTFNEIMNIIFQFAKSINTPEFVLWSDINNEYNNAITKRDYAKNIFKFTLADYDDAFRNVKNTIFSISDENFEKICNQSPPKICEELRELKKEITSQNLSDTISPIFFTNIFTYPTYIPN